MRGSSLGQVSSLLYQKTWQGWSFDGTVYGPGQNDDVFAPIDNAGARITLTVRHQSGGYQQLTAVPGVVT